MINTTLTQNVINTTYQFKNIRQFTSTKDGFDNDCQNKSKVIAKQNYFYFKKFHENENLSGQHYLEICDVNIL